MAASSSPTRLRAAQAAVAVVCVLLGVMVAVSASTRRADLDRASRASRLVVAAQDLGAALGTADAASANAFLAGGVDQPEQRARYSAALDAATAALQVAAETAESDEARSAVQQLTQLLPTYTGLVETARANNRQQLPLGAAYLRSASQLLRTDAATQLDALRAAGDASFRAVDQNLVAGVGGPLFAVALFVAIVLVLVQFWLSRRTRRLLNFGMVGATLLVLIGLFWVVNAVSYSSTRAVTAMQSGYDDLSALSAIRADAYDQQTFSTFALVDRGSRDSFNAKAATAANDVDTRIAALATGSLDAGWVRYRDLSRRVTATDTGGSYATARDQLTAPISAPSSVSGAFAQFDRTVVDEVNVSREVLTSGLADARRPMDRLRIIGVVIGLLAAAVGAWGLQQRINEYR